MNIDPEPEVSRSIATLCNELYIIVLKDLSILQQPEWITDLHAFWSMLEKQQQNENAVVKRTILVLLVTFGKRFRKK